MTSLTSGAYSTTAKSSCLPLETLRRVESIPGVEAAATMVTLPAGNMGIDLPFNIAGKAPTKGSQYNGDEQYRFVAGPTSKRFASRCCAAAALPRPTLATPRRW
jgi:hypothetical protein